MWSNNATNHSILCLTWGNAKCQSISQHFFSVRSTRTANTSLPSGAPLRECDVPSLSRTAFIVSLHHNKSYQTDVSSEITVMMQLKVNYRDQADLVVCRIKHENPRKPSWRVEISQRWWFALGTDDGGKTRVGRLAARREVGVAMAKQTSNGKRSYRLSFYGSIINLRWHCR